MVRVPTEKRYEEHIERELNSLLDDGLQFHSKVHHRDDTWYDKESCIVGDEFIDFLKESQKETYDILQKKYGENTHKNILKRLNKEIDNKGLIHVLEKDLSMYMVGILKLYFFNQQFTKYKYRKDKIKK